MPIMFNMLLNEVKLPLSEVRLLRHKDKSAEKGRTPLRAVAGRPATVPPVPGDSKGSKRKQTRGAVLGIVRRYARR